MTGTASPRRLNALRLALRQVRYQNRLLLRSPSGPFFTFVIPLMVLLALNLVYGNHTIPTRAGIRFPRFYTPAMAAFAITNACYVNLLTGVTLSRDEGMLKRIRWHAPTSMGVPGGPGRVRRLPCLPLRHRRPRCRHRHVPGRLPVAAPS